MRHIEAQGVGIGWIVGELNRKDAHTRTPDRG